MIKKVDGNISKENLWEEMHKIFLEVRSYCGISCFSEEENEILYTIVDVHSSKSFWKPATVFGRPTLGVLIEQLDYNERPLSDIIIDLNCLIDFLNFILKYPKENPDMVEYSKTNKNISTKQHKRHNIRRFFHGLL